MDSRPTPPGVQVHTASLTAATIGLILWGVEKYVFHGNTPPEVAAFIVLGVPWLGGRLGAQLAYRRSRRQLDSPKCP